MSFIKLFFCTTVIIKGLGRRSRTSIFYEAFSLSSGLDFSGSDSSRDQPGDTSDSSTGSLSPTSGYSSYDLLDQDLPPDMENRRSAVFSSGRESQSNSNKQDGRGQVRNQKRSVSVPRITQLK